MLKRSVPASPADLTPTLALVLAACLLAVASPQGAMAQQRDIAVAQAGSPDRNVVLSTPGTATVGSMIMVGWSTALDARDYVTIVPFGAPAGMLGDNKRVGDGAEIALRGPADPGLYEIRYVLDAGRSTAATVAIEIVDAEIEIVAPSIATAGSEFHVSWNETVNVADIITIVPFGSPVDVIGNTVRVDRDNPSPMQAPATSGIYEVRYVLKEGGRILASTRVEIVDHPDVLLTVPRSVTAGARFELLWSEVVNERDRITIVPAGTDAGILGNSVQANANLPATLVAPGEPGVYEVRYILNEDARTVATAEIEVTEAEVAVTALARAIAGGALEVTWSRTINSVDLVTIVPVGSPDGAIGTLNPMQVGGGGSRILEVPKIPGNYEVRYILRQGMRTLAAVEVEVLPLEPPSITLDAPLVVAAGEMFVVSWDPGVDTTDLRLVLARFEQPEFSWISSVDADGLSTVELRAPSEPGFYALRLVDLGNRLVHARALIEVTN